MSKYSERSVHAWTDDSIRIIATPSTFARSAMYYVQEAGYFKTLASYYTERRGLDSFLIVFTKSGRGVLKYKNKEYKLAPRSVFFIDCMEYQYYRQDSAQSWELLWVHLNGQSIRAYYEQFLALGETVVKIPQSSSIPALLKRLIKLNQFKSVKNELLSSQCIIELITDLVLLRPPLDWDPLNVPDFIRSAVQLFEKCYSQSFALTDLARQFGVNKTHFSKEFKKHTGLSPGEYIINIRMTRAKELLKYSNFSVGEIADIIGIEYVSHFINLFKKRTGLTPLAFRKSWRPN